MLLESLARMVFSRTLNLEIEHSQGLSTFCGHLGLYAAVSTTPATLGSSNLTFSMVALKLMLVAKFVYGWFWAD